MPRFHTRAGRGARETGRHGMGIVDLGESPGGRQVAVKLIRPDLAGDPEFRARFRREAEAARLVSGFHTAEVDRFGRPSAGLGRGELAEGTVRPGSIVVLQVLGQHPAQMVLIDDQHPVEQFPAQGAEDIRRRNRGVVG